MAFARGKAPLFILFFTILLLEIKGNQIRIVEDLQKLTTLQKQDSCLATLYVVDGNADQAVISRLQKVQALLKFYNIDLVQYECQKGTPRCPVDSCVKLTKTQYLSEDFALDLLHGKNAILAHFMTFCLADQLPYTDELQEWNNLLASQKGRRDVVLFFTEGYGTSIHSYLVEISYALSNKYQFTQTTEFNHPGMTGVEKNDGMALFYYKCREVKDLTKPCSYVKFERKVTKKSDIVGFLIEQDQDYANVSMLSKDGYTIFNDLLDHMLPLNLIYVFVGAGKIDSTKEILEAVSRKTEHAVQFIVVDKEKHWKIAERFGAFPPEHSPTLVVELRNFAKINQTFTAHWENSVPFTESQIVGFLDFLFTTPAQFFAIRAALYGPRCLEVKTVQDHNVLIGTAVGTCSGGDDACKDFEINFRRAVRTLFLAGERQLQIDYLYPQTVPENERSEPGPKLGYQAREDKFLKFEKDEMTYENILEFLVSSFSIHKVTPIPISGSDFVSICEVKDQSKVRKSQVPLYLERDEDEDEFEGQDSEVEEDESNAKMLSTEEDEVAKDFAAQRINNTFHVVKKSVYVKALTDKTYSEIIQSRGVFLVHFYLPWDARSYNFHAAYEKVAEQENEGKTSNVILADVNCHDWPDVCQKANVTSYPLVKIFVNGSSAGFYKGLLGESALLKAVRLYHWPFVTRLRSKEDITGFTEGKVAGSRLPPRTVSVLALLSSETEITMFTSIAKQFFGSAVFGYAEGKAASARAESYGLRSPSVVVFHPDDSYNPLRIAPSFQKEELITFIKASFLPTFGELTEDNFPEYHQLSRPYVILFKRKSEDTPLLETIMKIANTDVTKRVFLTWMNEERSAAAEIKHAYLGPSREPAVVFVDHNKGTIHYFESENKQSMSQWISDCLDGHLPSQAMLRDGKWTPLREGFDYLTLEAEEKKKKENMKLAPEEDSPPKKSGRFQFSPKVESPTHNHDEL